MNFKEINKIIQSHSNILEKEFENNNIQKAKEKNKYKCISCNSSDGLHLYSNTNTCHCYSCGQTWNVTNFIKQVQNIDYMEAIKYLNNTYNLDLPINNTKKQHKEEIDLINKLKTYKENEIKKLDEEYKEFKQTYDNTIEIIRKNKETDEKNKSDLEQTMFSLLFEKNCETEHKKEYIKSLTLDDIDINELLEIKILHPKQQKFINDKLKLVEKSDLEDKNLYRKYFETLKVNEYINYSKYKANETIYVDRYIEENNVLDKLLQYKHTLGIAPTGSGKTRAMLKMFKKMEKLLKKLGKKVCFIVPNATQVEQIQEEYKIKGAFSNADQNIIFNQNTISCYTWDKFGKIEGDLSNTIVVLDEIHQIYQDMYRKNKIDKMMLNIAKCSNRIDITATPNKIGFDTYDYIIEYKQAIQTNYNVKVYENINDDEIINIINNASGKVSILKDDIEYLKSLQNRISKDNDLVHSNNKSDNITYKNIIKNGILGDIEVIFHTTVFVAGININEPNMTDIIIVDIKDIATIKQYVARYRNLETVNVHIFNNYKNVNKIMNLENKVNYELNRVQEACINFNIDRLKGFETEFIEGNSIFKGLNKDLSIYKQDGIYKADEIQIRNRIYTNYYNRADIVSFKNLLEEYFNNITIISNEKIENNEIKEEIKEAKKTSKEYLEELEKHSHYLVDYYNIKKNKINTKTKDYLKANNLTQEKVIEYVESNNLEIMLDDTKVKKKLNSFTKLVNDIGYPSNLAYKLSNMNGKTKSNFTNKVNVLVFEEVYKKYKELMELDSPNVKLYFFILDEFPLSIGYDSNKVDESIIKLEKEHSIRLTNKQLQEYLNYVYVINSKQLKISKKVTQTTYINNKNSYSNVLPNSKLKTHKRVYCPIDYHTIESICKDYGLNDLDMKYIKNEIERRVRNVDFKAKKIIEHLKVFN